MKDINIKKIAKIAKVDQENRGFHLAEKTHRSAIWGQGRGPVSATDDTFETGNPGIGFNFGVGNTNVDHGLMYFEVDSYND